MCKVSKCVSVLSANIGPKWLPAVKVALLVSSLTVYTFFFFLTTYYSWIQYHWHCSDWYQITGPEWSDQNWTARGTVLNAFKIHWGSTWIQSLRPHSEMVGAIKVTTLFQQCVHKCVLGHMHNKKPQQGEEWITHHMISMWSCKSSV